MRLSYLAIFIAVLGIGVQFLKESSDLKIGYIRTSHLLENYRGMKEVDAVLSQKRIEWQSKLDTLKMDYNRAFSKYSSEVSGLSEEERINREGLLKQQNDNLMRYAQELDNQASEQEAKLTEGVLRQVDDYLKKYAKKNDYKVILGTTTTGSLLYADESMDITEEVLKTINRDYTKK